MKKSIASLLMLSSATAWAAPRVIVDETFATTFSDYGQIDKMLSCIPGFRGGFATADVLHLKNHTISLGVTLGSQDLQGQSNLGLENDPPHSRPGRRPFSEGCQPAIDRIKAAIAGKDIVEVDVHRRLVSYPNSDGRARRKVNGETLSVEYLIHEQFYESIEVKLAGFEFSLGQSVNGKTERP